MPPKHMAEYRARYNRGEIAHDMWNTPFTPNPVAMKSWYDWLCDMPKRHAFSEPSLYLQAVKNHVKLQPKT